MGKLHNRNCRFPITVNEAQRSEQTPAAPAPAYRHSLGSQGIHAFPAFPAFCLGLPLLPPPSQRHGFPGFPGNDGSRERLRLTIPSPTAQDNRRGAAYGSRFLRLTAQAKGRKGKKVEASVSKRQIRTGFFAWRLRMTDTGGAQDDCASKAWKDR